MANVGYATLSVIPSLNGFQRNLERGVTPGITTAGKSSGKRFGSAFGSAVRGTIAGLGIFTAASAAVRFLGDSVQEGRESVRIGKQTAAVIKSTGGAARLTEKQAGRLANTLKRMSGVDDEVIQGGENVLLTFKNIRNEQGENNKIFDKATKASLNLSTALGRDLNSSSLQVGKALNDPVKGLSLLSRAGVQFSKDQQDAVKKFVATGDTLSAQKVILRELNSEFRGSARAQRTEADKLSTAWGDFKEQIGKQLIPVLDDLAKFLRKKGIPRAKEFFGFVRDEGVPAVKKVAGFAKNAAGEVKSLVDEFRNMPDWVQKVLIGGFAGGVVAKKLGVGRALGATGVFSKGGTSLNPLYVFVTNPDLGGGGTKPPGGSKVAPLVKSVGTVFFGAAIAAAITAGVSKAIGPKTTRSLGSSGGGFGLGADSHFFDLDDEDIKRHNRQISETKKKWIDARLASQDYAFQVHNGIPRSAITTVTDWPLWNKRAKDYLATLLEIRDLHMDTRLDRAGVISPTAGGGIDPSNGTRPHGRPPGYSPRVVQNFNGPIRFNDQKEFQAWSQRKSVTGYSTGGY